MKFFWISFLLLIVGGKARLSRSPQAEIKKVRVSTDMNEKVNPNEYWPFPETLSEVDPCLLELRRSLLNKEEG